MKKMGPIYISPTPSEKTSETKEKKNRRRVGSKPGQHMTNLI
jgi:hypothetical protein